MEIYDTEEEQVAALKDWWKASSASVITGVVGAVIIVTGVNVWQSYQKDTMNQASAIYENIMDAQKSGKLELIGTLGTKLNANYASTAYSAYALLFQAKAKVEQQDLPAAKTLLEQALTSTSDAELKHVTRARLIRVLLALGENENGLQIIADIDQSSLGGFEAIYEELKGDLYVAMTRIGEARTAYQSALKLGQGTPLLQFKLDDLTADESLEG